MLSEMEAMKRGGGGAGGLELGGGGSGGGNPSGTLSGDGILGSRKGKKFTSQQHLFRQMDRKYKRLVSEMEQVQAKHRLEMKEVWRVCIYI